MIWFEVAIVCLRLPIGYKLTGQERDNIPSEMVVTKGWHLPVEALLNADVRGKM